MTQREFFNAVIEGSATAKDGTVINIIENGEFTEAAIEFAKGRIAAIDKSNENRKNGTSKTAQATRDREFSMVWSLTRLIPLRRFSRLSV